MPCPQEVCHEPQMVDLDLSSGLPDLGRGSDAALDNGWYAHILLLNGFFSFCQVDML